ncbi:MAG: signal recognition particle-docking protein FtsY [Candidatus Norongarragalinales archaeon]
MFGLLKNKLKAFVDGLVKREEAKPTEPLKPVESKPAPKSIENEIYAEAVAETEKKAFESKREPPSETEFTPAPASKPCLEVKPPRAIEEKECEREREHEIAPKLSLLKKIKSVFSREVEIGEAEVASMLGELEIALLESDVSLETTQFLADDLKRRLVGKRVEKAMLNEAVRGEVRAALLDLFAAPAIDFAGAVREKKARGEPFVVLFIGPNGMGKTTTIAKIAKWLGERGYSSVFAASDSFRAAAIEQLEHHGVKLGVSVVKHKYGADPTAVAFDAIAHARAKRIDVVLIDTAGRQETNVNLVKEMQKMSRVLKPDLRVFVGEAVAGHALVEQLKKFKEAVGVDALVLTKLDCDAKGGSAFSAAFEARVPILFVGIGQGYEDLREFDAAWLVDNVLSA